MKPLLFLFVAQVAHAQVDAAALEKLVARAAESKSSALVVMKDGKVIADWRPPGEAAHAIETMSATKSIVNLAIGRLIDDGKIKSLDEPVWRFFPEWKQGRKKAITVRHLLNHTSGLQAQPTTGEEIYPSPDFVKLALAAELSDDPGTRFSYNNKAVNLLAGVVKAASGQPLDEYLRDVLFTPLGISDWKWTHDKAGNPHAMAGLRLRAIDLARIGQLLLDGGVWQGKRVISQKWIEQSTVPGQKLTPRCGLLWWLVLDGVKVTIDEPTIAAWRAAKLDEEFIAKVLPMKGKIYERKEFFAALGKIFEGSGGLETWYAHTWKRGLPDGALIPGPTVGYYADGYLGQYLVVLPKQRLVAVRQLEAKEDSPDAKNYDAFTKFTEMVQALVR
jgi:CubicO group peptidase (beta-lactamase class C family)